MCEHSAVCWRSLRPAHFGDLETFGVLEDLGGFVEGPTEGEALGALDESALQTPAEHAPGAMQSWLSQQASVSPHPIPPLSGLQVGRAQEKWTILGESAAGKKNGSASKTVLEGETRASISAKLLALLGSRRRGTVYPCSPCPNVSLNLKPPTARWKASDVTTTTEGRSGATPFSVPGVAPMRNTAVGSKPTLYWITLDVP